jgi:GH35 family endo-1,4-beta-xylanase
LKLAAITAGAVLAALLVVVEPSPGAADPIPLKTLAATARGADGIKIGSAINSVPIGPGPDRDETYEQRAAAEFSLIAPENDLTWQVTEPTRPELEDGHWKHTYVWDRAEEVVGFGEQNGQTVIGQHLVWYNALPEWWPTIPNPDPNDPTHPTIPNLDAYPQETVHQFLQDRVVDTVSRFKGRVAYWSVVNEVLAEDGTWRPSIWQRAYPNLDSYAYIADSFRWARAADPNAKLYINEYGVEGNTAKARALYDLVKRLLQDHVPIDGVGFQAHLKLTDGITGFADMLRRFAELGVEVYVTELDVRIHDADTSGATQLQQAEVFGRAVRACLDVAACKFVNMWGFTDAHSWIGVNYYLNWGRATMLTDTYAAKPAYDRIAAELADWTAPLQDMAGWWRLDDWGLPNGAQEASDVSGHGRPAAVSGAPLGHDGRVPGYSAFLGDESTTQAATAATAGTVLDTTKPFTVSAWVSLADFSRDQVVVSQDAATRTAFSLGFNFASQKWYFSMADTATPGPGFQQVLSDSVPQRDVWTHLTGAWNPTLRRLVLYVNGKRDKEFAPPPSFHPWVSAGALRIGAAMNGRWFKGSISDVRAYQRVLSDAEVLEATTAGNFALDGLTGDTSFFLRDGNPRPDLTRWLGTPGQMPAALRLTAQPTDPRIEAFAIDIRRQVLNTDRSYSVSAWLNLDQAAVATTEMVAVAQDGLTQDGVTRSAFRLGVRGGKWSFSIRTADAQPMLEVTSSGMAGVGWTHLVGVYDAQAGQLRLYVNRLAQSPTAGVTTWASHQGVHLGQAFDGPRWVGGIDDVRFYQAPLTQNEVNLIPGRS